MTESNESGLCEFHPWSIFAARSFASETSARGSAAVVDCVVAMNTSFRPWVAHRRRYAAGAPAPSAQTTVFDPEKRLPPRPHPHADRAEPPHGLGLDRGDANAP